MAITLGGLRQYAVDMAHDMSDAKADALVIYWLNQALEHLWRAHGWIHFAARQRITLEPEVDGDDDLNLTLGSATITRDTAWDTSWVSELWDLHVTGSGVIFQLSAPTSGSTTTATLATGQVWHKASATDQSYVLSRSRYTLPSSFVRRNVLVHDLLRQQEIPFVPPSEYDRIRALNPGQRSSQPQCYTLRGAGFIEFYPAPGSDYVPVDLTYHRKPTLHAVADADATEVDWPEEYQHLLRLAVETQAARTQGENAQVPYALCASELERAILSAKSLDVDKGHRDRSVSLGFHQGRGWGRLYRNPGTMDTSP